MWIHIKTNESSWFIRKEHILYIEYPYLEYDKEDNLVDNAFGFVLSKASHTEEDILWGYIIDKDGEPLTERCEVLSYLNKEYPW